MIEVYKILTNKYDMIYRVNLYLENSKIIYLEVIA